MSVLCVSAVLSAANLWAADTAIDENALFADTSSITQSADVVDNQLIKDQTAEKKSVSISGEITSAAVAMANRDWFKNLEKQDLSLTTYVVGNLFLDIRQTLGTKAFANLETRYLPSSNQTLVGLKELFIDWNIKNKAYFRTGKQVLQWGRCYFWNPTDLINVEKKLFIQKIGYREGAYGLKVHVPFGTTWNIYSFIDTKDASAIDSVAAAGKVEFLWGKTEMALSAWGKGRCHPVFGFDISSRLFRVDLSGELSLAAADNYFLMKVVDDTMLAKSQGDHQWQPRLCVALSKSFTVMDIKDRLSVTSEFYYNGNGYTGNAFNDTAQYPYLVPIAAIGANGMPVLTTAGTKTGFLEGNNLYEMNSFSKYYLAFFTGFGKFILSDMTLMVNAIGNLEQKSAVVSTGVSYNTLNNFSTGLSINAFVGPQNTEYTFSGNALTVQAIAGITF